MIVDDHMICDFVQLAGLQSPNSFKITEFTLLNLDSVYKAETKFGIRNETIISIENKSYLIIYKRIWPDWTSTKKETRMKGNITVSLQGDEGIFIQHLMVLKLS